MKSTLIPTDEPEFTTQEIAQRLRVDPAAIRKWFTKERMPGRKVAYRKILFRWSQVNAWLERREARKEKERQARPRQKPQAEAAR